MIEQDFLDRISFMPEEEIVEIDLEGLTFTTAHEANVLYDAINRAVTETGRTWYFLGCFADCRIFPGAALQFSIRRSHAHEICRGAVRYGCSEAVDNALLSLGSDTKAAQTSFATRDDAIEHINGMKAAVKLG